MLRGKHFGALEAARSILHRAFETIADFMDEAGIRGQYGWEYRRKEIGDILAGWGDLDEVITNNDAHAHR